MCGCFSYPWFPFLFPEGKSAPDTSVIYRSSMQLDECEAEEEFTLGGRTEHLHVAAYPLHRHQCVEDPPTVVAAFTPP